MPIGTMGTSIDGAHRQIADLADANHHPRTGSGQIIKSQLLDFMRRLSLRHVPPAWFVRQLGKWLMGRSF